MGKQIGKGRGPVCRQSTPGEGPPSENSWRGAAVRELLDSESDDSIGRQRTPDSGRQRTPGIGRPRESACPGRSGRCPRR